MLTSTTRAQLLVGNETRTAQRRSLATSRAAASMVGKTVSEQQRAVLQVDSDSDDAADEAAYDPLRVLGTDRERCRHVTELHLGRKQLRRVPGLLQAFGGLEELWLNGNAIAELRGLLPAGAPSLHEGSRGCLRLRRLYLQHNQLTTADGDLALLPHLETLDLAGNRLSGMDVTVRRLVHLRQLRQLSLCGNPLAEEANYRLYVVHNIPSIAVLDGEAVTAAERKRAAALFGKGSARREPRHAFGSAKPAPRDAPEQRAQPMSRSAALVGAKVRQLQLREATALQAAEARESHEMAVRREKRRLFRSVWPSHGPATSHGPTAPAPAPGGGGPGGAAVDSGSLMSPLFAPGNDGSDVARLIALAAAREAAAADPAEQRRLDAQIAALRPRLAPERGSDCFAEDYAAHRAATRVATTAAEDTALLRSAFSAAETEKVRRLFAESGKVHAGGASSMLAGMTIGPRLPDTAAVDAFFAAAVGGDTQLDVAAALRLLLDHGPFLAARIDELRDQAAASLARGLPAAAAAALQRLNSLASHQRRLMDGGPSSSAPQLVGSLLAAAPPPPPRS